MKGDDFDAIGSRRSWPTQRRGFGGPLHASEIMKNMNRRRGRGVHFETSSRRLKNAVQPGRKVLVPTQRVHHQNWWAAR